MRTILRVTIVLVSAALVVGCGSATSTPGSSNVTGTPTGTEPTAAATAATSAPKVASVGQTQTDNGLQVTVTKVTALTPGQYDSIKTGDQYLVVRVQITNTNNSSQDYNPYYFQIRNKEGNQTSTTYTSSYVANDELNSGTLAAGGKVTGDLVFEVATADHAATVVWTPNMFNETTYVWDVGW